MSSVTMTARPGSLEALEVLVERFDPELMDVPGGEARIRLDTGQGKFDAVIASGRCRLDDADDAPEPDAVITAEAAVWESIAVDVRAGMEAFRGGRLKVRENLHLGVGFLAATGNREENGLRFDRVQTANHDVAYLEAGEGSPLICIHGLGGTKASFLTTVSALAPEGFRVIALDLPGFGDSGKPQSGRYDAPWFAQAIVEFMDELGIERADFAGNSMGGRVAIEAGLMFPDRVDKLVLLSPALAWLRDRGWKWLLRLPLPQLGYLQPTPRWAVEPVVRKLVPGAESGWTAAGVDEFLRSYLTPAGRFAFYESARNIYMDEPHGDEGFWPRLRALAPDSLFVWGKQDMLVPISFMRHVEEALPAARHLEQDCGHVPQLEAPRQTHAAMLEFLRG